MDSSVILLVVTPIQMFPDDSLKPNTMPDVFGIDGSCDSESLGPDIGPSAVEVLAELQTGLLDLQLVEVLELRAGVEPHLDIIVCFLDLDLKRLQIGEI